MFSEYVLLCLFVFRLYDAASGNSWLFRSFRLSSVSSFLFFFFWFPFTLRLLLTLFLVVLRISPILFAEFLMYNLFFSLFWLNQLID